MMIAAAADIAEITDICTIPKDFPEAEAKLFPFEGVLSDDDPGIKNIKNLLREFQVAL